jgi:hypothetical protein
MKYAGGTIRDGFELKAWDRAVNQLAYLAGVKLAIRGSQDR